ncbi:MAG: beta-ketoacyl-ACP synthase II [Clostridiales bacterium]|nr:beta-ketoacyl-ACP synthase II [Clostridiales bacterium]
MKRRVVVTGMGAISSIGHDIETIWENLKNGVSGVDLLTKINPDNYPSKFAGEVRNFDAEKYIDRKKARRMDLYCHYAIAASKNAIEDSKISLEKIDLHRFGVIIGSGIGGIGTFEREHKKFLERGPSKVSPFFIPMMIPNMAAGLVSIEFKAKGICESVVTACSSGNNAIGNSYKAIKNGEMDVMIAGGAEASITDMGFAGFCNMRAVSRAEVKEKASRPFDKERDGFVMSEGAGIVILEEYEHAKKRGAKIIAEVVGYGTTSDAYHMTAPAENGEGGARSMQQAVDTAGLDIFQIDYINAHGTSTPLNDVNETKAIKTVFKEHAYGLNVSSTKSMTGHMLGAAGGFEAIVCCLALQNGFIPPTINYSNKDEECDLNYTVNKGVKRNIKYALSNSLGFGGHNSSVIFKKGE